MKELEVIGRSVGRVDARGKVTGKARFAADLSLPGVLYAKTLRCPFPHARLLSLDTSKAERLPGVVAVLTADDVPGFNGHGIVMPDQPVLVPVGGTARLRGDPIALVAAESEAIAEKALGLIEVEYKKLEAVTDPEAAMQDGAPILIEGEERNICGEHHFQRGDVAIGFAEADVIVENVFHTPRQEHAYLEPEAGLATVDDWGHVTVYTGAQDPVFYLRDPIAKALDLPENKVRVVALLTGGAFGGKTDVSLQIHLALLAFKTGRPVKMVWTREESMALSTKRHPMRIRHKIGATKEGRITAIEAEVLADAGAYVSCSPYVIGVACGQICGPYNVPHVKLDGYAVRTNNPISGACRGYGEPQGILVIECQIDALARRLGMDFIELRLKNAVKPGMEPVIPGTVLNSPVTLPETIQLACREAGPLPEPSGSGKLVGRGIACAMPCFDVTGYPWGALAATGASVEMFEDGAVTVRCGVCEVGTGILTVLAQIVAEELQVDVEDVEVIFGDSAYTPKTGPVVFSRSAYCAGNAVKLAAEKLKARLMEKAAGELNVGVEDLRLEKGRFLGAKDPEQGLTVAEAAALCYRHGVNMVSEGWLKSEREGVGHSYITTVADVEIDEETGQVTVLKLINCHDSGKALNPLNVKGQLIGGAIMGLGWVLSEDVPVEEGVILTPSLAEYLIPTAMDTPEESEALIIESPYPSGPYGAKGCGEASTSSAAPAILGAINNALRGMITELPATPDRVLKALREKATQEA
jgi:CO/xanthine dehydrogenase Mo-binding subunit